MFDERFCLAIAFFAFVTLIVRYVVPAITAQLEAKSKQIAEELLAAKEMKEKAEQLLIASQKRHEEALAFAEQLIKDSVVESQKYFEESLKLAEIEIAKKVSAVENRIKQEQERVVREMKIKIIESTINVAQSNLDNMQKAQSGALAKKSIDDISKLVH
jgi:F0F1-type ATP synthase membrane subunit b/b'